MILLTMLIIPTLVALGFFLFAGKEVNLKEFIAQNLAQVLVMSCFMGYVYWQNTYDVEVWNGRVVDKKREIVSCEHSYTCNCVTVSCGKDCSTVVCQTCYEHSYDVNWPLYTSNEEQVKIDRVDRQGTIEPSRWTQIQIGEPTTIAHSFKNYIKAAPDSLFRKQGLVDKYKDQLPSYPGEVYDYYHVDRFVALAKYDLGAKEWNKDLEIINADLGKSKEVNMIIVVVQDKPEDYFFALEQYWLGGKKNDFIAVINLTSDKITWTKVMAWTDNKLAEVVVADNVTKVGTMDRTKIIEAIRTGVKDHFIRKHMKDYEYLSHQVKPSIGQWIFALLLGLTISIGLGMLFVKEEFFN